MEMKFIIEIIMTKLVVDEAFRVDVAGFNNSFRLFIRRRPLS
jgi:hypothetical protein